MTASESGVDFVALTERFVAAQLLGDRREASRLLVDEGIDRGARVIDLQDRVVRAAQLEIGRLWQANRVTIAQEHLATGVAQLAMARLFEYVAPPIRNGIVVAVGCVEGEFHELPARLVADYLEHAGFDVRYFGANVPIDEFVALVTLEQPRVLALSITMSFNVPALRTTIRRVRDQFAELAIVIGGHALDWSPDLMTELGVIAASAHPDAVIDAVRRSTGVS